MVVVVSLNRIFSELLASKLRGYDGLQVRFAGDAMPLCFNPAADVLLLDWTLPRRESRPWLKGARIILFNVPQDIRAIRRAMAAGAFSCIPASSSFSDLREALRFAQKGQRWLPEDLLVQEIGSQVSQYELRYGFTHRLSRREREVATLSAAGLPAKRIAAHLDVSVQRARDLLCLVSIKTGACSPAELLARLRKPI